MVIEDYKPIIIVIEYVDTKKVAEAALSCCLGDFFIDLVAKYLSLVKDSNLSRKPLFSFY